MMDRIPALTNLAAALEQATLMAKQLPTTTDPSQILQIYSTLHSAHQHLAFFLAQSANRPHHPPPQPSLLLPLPPAAAENSLSSTVGNDDNEPMQVGDSDGDEAEAEQNSKTPAASTTIDRVEERMRDCFIQNKRSKRPLSPSSAAAERQQSYNHESVGDPGADFDPHGTKMRALDLIYQFHG